MEYRFIKTGAFAGKTVNLGGYQFVEGVYTLGPNKDGVSPSPQDAASLGDYLGKCYEAYQEGSEKLAAVLAAAEAGVAVEPAKPADHGHTDEARARRTLVAAALVKLDPENDEHWTSGGLPSVEAVRALSETADVSRADIQEAAPKLTREEAKKVAADPLAQ